eukprot:scaffold82165_cov75-Phaeocystis_antarctica.AAC.2
MVVTLDVLKLRIGWLNASARCQESRCGTRDVRAWDASGVQGEGSIEGWGPRREHARGRTLGDLSVGRQWATSAQAEGGHAMRGEVRPGRREGVGWQQRNRHARGWPTTQGLGGQGTRGAHFEHLFHGRDLGRVEAERLVERRRELPNRKAGRGGTVDAGRGTGKGGLDCRCGAGLELDAGMSARKTCSACQ